MIKYWALTTDDSSRRTITTKSNVPAPLTTTDPNSLGELMRNAFLVQGDSFPHDPKEFAKAQKALSSYPHD